MTQELIKQILSGRNLDQLASKLASQSYEYFIENNFDPQYLSDSNYLKFWCLFAQEYLLRYKKIKSKLLLSILKKHTVCYADFIPYNYLPFSLQPYETNVPLPKYSDTSNSVGLFSSSQSQPYSYECSNIPSEIRSSLSISPYITSVLYSWTEEGNPDITILKFHTKNPILTHTTQSNIHINLPSMDEVKTMPFKGFIYKSTLTEIYSLLFQISAYGTSISRGEGGAIARMRALETLLGFCEINHITSQSFELLYTKASQIQWFTLDLSSWFQSRSMHLGIIALHPDNKSMTLFIVSQEY